MIAALLLAAAQDPSTVLLLRNRAAPQGAEVAAAWRRWRSASGAREFVLDVAAEEQISRAEYERDVAAPLREYLAGEEGAGVRWIVPVYGVPLGVREQPGLDGSSSEQTQRNEASLDSELALLRLADVRRAGWIESPLFDRAEPLGAGDEILGVARLDGPTAAIAIGLVEKAVLAELFGAEGASFLDTRGLTDPEDGYGQRDVHMRTVADAWRRLGIPFEHDDLPAVVDLAGRSLLHYEGWYAGDPSGWSGAPRFRAGAIAVHLHSFAAHTLRDPRANWTAPLLDWGATATVGTVYEPYTIGFPYEGVFWDRIAGGWSFGEAGAASSMLLSWQAVLVGDPLYRPYPPGAREAQAGRRAAFAAALRAWPRAPEAEPFAGFAAAWEYFDARLAAITAGSRRGADLALSEWLALHRLGEGWGFDDEVAAALGGSLGDALERVMKECERALGRDAADPEALARLEEIAEAAPAFGLGERHAALLERLKADQEEFVAKALARREPLPRSGRLLERWQELRRAEACVHAARAAEAGAARAALEQDPERSEPLRKEADEALSKELRQVEQWIRRGRFGEAAGRLRALDRDHPECPAKDLLRTLAEQARRGLAGG